jgi:aspartate kinase
MGMQYQIRNVDVQFVINPSDFDAAVRVLHEALIEDMAAAKSKAA